MAKDKIKKPKKFRPKKSKGEMQAMKNKTAIKLESSDLTLIQKCFYKKDNAILKKNQLDSKIKIAQLEAQNVMQGVQKEIEESSKEYGKVLEGLCEKYGINLEVDKINLVEGLITRAEAPPIQEEEAEDAENYDESDDEEEEGE